MNIWCFPFLPYFFYHCKHNTYAVIFKSSILQGCCFYNVHFIELWRTVLMIKRYYLWICQFWLMMSAVLLYQKLFYKTQWIIILHSLFPPISFLMKAHVFHLLLISFSFICPMWSCLCCFVAIHITSGRRTGWRRGSIYLMTGNSDMGNEYETIFICLTHTHAQARRSYCTHSSYTLIPSANMTVQVFDAASPCSDSKI